MNIQRMKFAWARGARFQYESTRLTKPITKVWVDIDLRESPSMRLFMDRNLRIHPEDEHLQYGPLSSKILATVERGYWESSGPFDRLIANLGITVNNWIEGELDHYPNCQLQDQNLVLFAEMLADEGL